MLFWPLWPFPLAGHNCLSQKFVVAIIKYYAEAHSDWESAPLMGMVPVGGWETQRGSE